MWTLLKISWDCIIQFIARFTYIATRQLCSAHPKSLCLATEFFLRLLFSSLVSKIPIIGNFSRFFFPPLGFFISHSSNSKQFSFFQTPPILYPSTDYLTLFKKKFFAHYKHSFSVIFKNNICI